MDLTAPNIPPCPHKLTIQLEDIGDGIAYQLRYPRLVESAFCLCLLATWVVGGMTFAIAAWNRPNIFTFLFGIPYCAGICVLVGKIIYNYTFYESFQLDPAGVTWSRQAIFVLSRYEIQLSDIQDFAVCEVVQRGHKSKLITFYGIELRGVRQNLQFAFSLPEAERVWLCYELHETWRQLQRQDRLDADQIGLQHESPLEPSRPSTETDTDRPELAPTSESTPVELPNGLPWQVTEESGSIKFTERGQWNQDAVIGMTVLCAFLDGIVSVFICQLWGLIDGGPRTIPEWWGMFCFLIPFKVIGLFVLTLWLLTLVDRWRTTSWWFGPDAIRCQTAWCGLISWNWKYRFTSYGRLNVVEQREQQTIFDKIQLKGVNLDTEPQSSLIIVDQNNIEICTLSGLPLDQAQWMKNEIMQSHPEWFPRS